MIKLWRREEAFPMDGDLVWLVVPIIFGKPWAGLPFPSLLEVGLLICLLPSVFIRWLNGPSRNIRIIKKNLLTNIPEDVKQCSLLYFEISI